VENRTRTHQPRQDIYWRRGPGEGSFDCQLPAEARAELLEEIPPPKTYRREIPTYRPLEPPPPVLPPSVTPRARPAQSESSSGSGIWLLLAVLLGLPILLAMLSQAVSSGTQPQSRSVEVRRALPVVEVRRALPAVPRALPVTSAVSTVSNAGWQSVRMPDGTIVQVCYQGELPSSAALPNQGRFIGEEWSPAIRRGSG
jgi:hypothetical protein